MSEREQKALLNLIARRIGLSYSDVVAWLESENSLAAIEERILRGNYANAVVNVDQAAKMLASELTESYIASGRQQAKWIDSKVPDRLVRFDTTDPRVVARARANELELVQGFLQEQNQIARQVTRRAIEESATLGTNPRRIAQDFKSSIGLSAQGEVWTANYRRALENGDYLRATGYELSSGQADRTLRSYADSEKTLTPAQIDDYVERYKANAIEYRATTIARTEALRNANAGADDAIRQAIARGDINAADLTKEWHAGPPTKDARADHQAMDREQVGVNEPFVFPDGTRMMRPGDPDAPASHTANCRCTVSIAFAL